MMRLARLAGLESLVTRIVTVPGGAGANAAAKVASIVAGMLTGADSILDMDGLREGAVGKVLPGVKAPSTLGTFLRAFTEVPPVQRTVGPAYSGVRAGVLPSSR